MKLETNRLKPPTPIHHPFPNATYNLSNNTTPQCKLQYAMDPRLTHGYSKPCGRQTSQAQAHTPIHQLYVSQRLKSQPLFPSRHSIPDA
jgi:hypothetical protein